MAKKITKPTPKEIKAEIALLKKMQPEVRHFSAFNDDNRAAIGAQLEVLEEDLDEDDIYKRWAPPDEDDEDAEENDDASQNSLDEALAARHWLDGDEREPPSESWKGLVK